MNHNATYRTTPQMKVLKNNIWYEHPLNQYLVSQYVTFDNPSKDYVLHLSTWIDCNGSYPFLTMEFIEAKRHRVNTPDDDTRLRRLDLPVESMRELRDILSTMLEMHDGHMSKVKHEDQQKKK